MASWHQMRNPVKRYHETKWSVWVDPPNEPAGIYLYDAEPQANEMKALLEQKGEKYVYIYVTGETLMQVTRIDYSIADYKYQSGQSFYENCDPPKAIAMFQAMCREHDYPFTITNWAWFSRLGA